METRVFGTETTSQDFQEPRAVWQSIKRGMSGKCPACGEGKLFARWITVDDACPHCHEEMHHHRADDLPAYLNIFVVGHVVVGVMMVVMQLELMSVWPLTALTALIALAAALLGLQPIKGGVVGAQWAMRMHGFGGHED